MRVGIKRQDFIRQKDVRNNRWLPLIRASGTDRDYLRHYIP